MPDVGHPNPWRFNDVIGVSEGDDAQLVHTAGGELWVYTDRLVRGEGYETAPRRARWDLARAGAILRLRRKGRYHVHASGVVDPRGRAWIFTGVSGSGKSTMAYALARRGWRVLGDDSVIVEPHRQDDGVTAYAWRETVLISARLAPDFPELGHDAEARAIPGDPRQRVPTRVSLAHSGPVAAVIRLAQGDRDELAPITPMEMLVELVRQSAWVVIRDPAARMHLEGLRSLATRVPVFHLTHSPRQLQAIAETLASTGI